MKIYRNTFVFILFAFLTINACKIENAKNRHFCVGRAEFTSNTNEHRFSFYIDDDFYFYLFIKCMQSKRL